MKLIAGLVAGLVGTQVASAQFNHAEALQQSIYFYECQESGELSPGNRVAWRGPSCMDDGKDAGLDLTGGWNDAGDHWKSNLTMAHAAALLAWSAVQYPDAYTRTGQMPHLLNGLKHVNDYFLKCIVDPKPGELNSFDGYELYIDIGGKPGPDPGVHSVWCAPEVIDGYTVREALKVNAKVPGADVAGCQSAAMAASAIVFAKHGQLEYAQKLLEKAEKLLNFAMSYPSTDEKAITPDGRVRKIEYRSGKVPQMLIWSNLWMHRAREAVKPRGYDGGYLKVAQERYDSYEWNWGHVDLYIAQYDLANSMLLMQIAPGDPRALQCEAHLRRNLDLWEALKPTPHGFKIREVYGGWFTLKWAMGQVALASMYADWTKDAAQKARFDAYVTNQVDYVLGKNNYGKSYMIGFGENGWFTTPHHRGATGAWRGFAHFEASKPFHLKEVRHTLYGAMLAGMDLNDQRTDDMMKHHINEVALDFNAPLQMALAALVAREPGKYRPIPEDQFPPKVQKQLTLNPDRTDREYFVVAKIAGRTDRSMRIEGHIHNQSQWPSRVTPDLSFRYYLTLENGITANDLKVEVSGQGAKLAGVKEVAGNLCAIEVSFAGERLAPFTGNARNGQPAERFRRGFTLIITAPSAWDTANDFSVPKGEGEIVPQMPVFDGGKLLEGDMPEQASRH